jgi:hypothetical protein
MGQAHTTPERFFSCSAAILLPFPVSSLYKQQLHLELDALRLSIRRPCRHLTSAARLETHRSRRLRHPRAPPVLFPSAWPLSSLRHGLSGYSIPATSTSTSTSTSSSPPLCHSAVLDADTGRSIGTVGMGGRGRGLAARREQWPTDRGAMAVP